MEEHLYIASDDIIEKGTDQTGESRPGTYAARVQTGIEKDGSPQYRYFRTQAEYEDYQSKQRKEKQEKGPGKKGPGIKERLQSKLKEEQRHSSEKEKTAPSRKVSEARAKDRSLFTGKNRSVKKSIRLYLGENNYE